MKKKTLIKNFELYTCIKKGQTGTYFLVEYITKAENYVTISVLY